MSWSFRISSHFFSHVSEAHMSESGMYCCTGIAPLNVHTIYLSSGQGSTHSYPLKRVSCPTSPLFNTQWKVLINRIICRSIEGEERRQKARWFAHTVVGINGGSFPAWNGVCSSAGTTSSWPRYWVVPRLNLKVGGKESFPSCQPANARPEDNTTLSKDLHCAEFPFLRSEFQS